MPWVIKPQPRAARYLGTYYYAGPLLGIGTCGHKHATVRAAMKCKRKFKDPRIYAAWNGRLPASILD